MDRPIPAFYCCYLLRSTVRHQSLYVGSTPDPRRRLDQHNGKTKGGAVRTSRASLRPWEMTCLVTGFPSKIAALQFEWAWQNTHLTRHIEPEERITHVQKRISPKTGKPRKRPGRPRVTLSDKLANLQILLGVSSFRRWPLHIRFYASDVHAMWQKVTSQRIGLLPEHKYISQEYTETRKGDKLNLDPTKPGPEAIDATYRPMKPQLEKSLSILSNETSTCSICSKTTDPEADYLCVCPSSDCNAVSHLECLGDHFIRQNTDLDTIVPKDGSCPKCKSELEWSNLMHDLTLRTRGEKARALLFKQRRRRKGEAMDASAVAEDLGALSAEELSEPPDESESEDESDPVGLRLPSAVSASTKPATSQKRKAPVAKDPEVISPTTRKVGRPRKQDSPKSARDKDSDLVIEDSDWDSAQVLD